MNYNVSYVGMLIFLHLVLISHESGDGDSKLCCCHICTFKRTNYVSHQRLKYLWGVSPSDCSADSSRYDIHSNMS
jgi:hypothetical protein